MCFEKLFINISLILERFEFIKTKILYNILQLKLFYLKQELSQITTNLRIFQK